MGPFGTRLLQWAMSGSLTLWQLRSVLISQSHVMTKDHADVPSLDFSLRYCAELGSWWWEAGNQPKAVIQGEPALALALPLPLPLICPITLAEIARAVPTGAQKS